MSNFEIFLKTPDVEIKATGRDIEELFVYAAKGLISYMYGDNLRGMGETSNCVLELESSSYPELLGKWLVGLLTSVNELQMAPMVYMIPDIHEKALASRVQFVSAPQINHVAQIKTDSITITEIENGWTCTFLCVL